MPFLRANFRVGGVVVNLSGAALSAQGGVLIPTGYLAASAASQLMMYRGDAFVVYNPAASTL